MKRVKIGVETLGRDRHGKLSSKPPLKKAVRGFVTRGIEKAGHWEYISGYLFNSSATERAISREWYSTLMSLGYRVGSHDYDGVRSFYLWVDQE